MNWFVTVGSKRWLALLSPPPAVFNYDTTWLYGPLFSNAPRGEKWGRTMRPEIGLKEQASERAYKSYTRFSPGAVARVITGHLPKWAREGAANVRIHFLLSFSLSLSAMRRQFPSLLLSLLHHFLSGPIPFLRRPWPAQIFLLPTLRKGKGRRKRGKQDTRIATKWLSRVFPPPAHSCFRPSGRIVTAM